MTSYTVPTVTPLLIFTPLTTLTNSLQLQNIGSNPVYVGDANVTPFNGFQVIPGKPVNYQPGLSQTVYTCAYSAVGANTAAATLGTGTGIATVGTTKLTVTTMNSSFAAGTTLQLGTTTNREFVVVASTATTVVTISNPTLYYHPVGDVMTLATSSLSNLKITPGVL